MVRPHPQTLELPSWWRADAIVRDSPARDGVVTLDPTRMHAAAIHLEKLVSRGLRRSYRIASPTVEVPIRVHGTAVVVTHREFAEHPGRCRGLAKVIFPPASQIAAVSQPTGMVLPNTH